MRRRQVFLKKKFNAIGSRLEQSKRPDTRGAPAVLHVTDDLALQPDAVSDRSEHYNQRQGSLNQPRDNEYRYAQAFPAVFLCVALSLILTLGVNQSAATSASVGRSWFSITELRVRE